MTCLHCKFGLAVNILILCLFLLVNLASCYLPVKTASLPVDTTNVGTEHLPVDIVHQLGVWFKKIKMLSLTQDNGSTRKDSHKQGPLV